MQSPPSLRQSRWIIFAGQSSGPALVLIALNFSRSPATTSESIVANTAPTSNRFVECENGKKENHGRVAPKSVWNRIHRRPPWGVCSPMEAGHDRLDCCCSHQLCVLQGRYRPELALGGEVTACRLSLRCALVHLLEAAPKAVWNKPPEVPGGGVGLREVTTLFCNMRSSPPPSCLQLYRYLSGQLEQ